MPKGKHIINNKQKRAALVSCTLFAFMGLMVVMCLSVIFLLSMCYERRFCRIASAMRRMTPSKYPTKNAETSVPSRMPSIRPSNTSE